MARSEKKCNNCGEVKRLDATDKKKSEFTTKGAYWRDICKVCDNKRANRDRRERRALEGHIKGSKPSLVGRKPKGQDAVTVKWCPRGEWPSDRYFSRGAFTQMLEDGILTPGMHVDYHGKKHVVWGPRGQPQWMVEL